MNRYPSPTERLLGVDLSHDEREYAQPILAWRVIAHDTVTKREIKRVSLLAINRSAAMIDSLPLLFPDGEDDRPAAGLILQVDRVRTMVRI